MSGLCPSIGQSVIAVRISGARPAARVRIVSSDFVPVIDGFQPTIWVATTRPLVVGVTPATFVAHQAALVMGSIPSRSPDRGRHGYLRARRTTRRGTRGVDQVCRRRRRRRACARERIRPKCTKRVIATISPYRCADGDHEELLDAPVSGSGRSGRRDRPRRREDRRGSRGRALRRRTRRRDLSPARRAGRGGGAASGQRSRSQLAARAPREPSTACGAKRSRPHRQPNRPRSRGAAWRDRAANPPRQDRPFPTPRPRTAPRSCS